MTKADFDFIDEQRNADLLDAMADIAYEQEQAMRESLQSEWLLIENNNKFVGFTVINQEEDDWDGIEEISNEERYACDLYNEMYVHSYYDN